MMSTLRLASSIFILLAPLLVGGSLNASPSNRFNKPLDVADKPIKNLNADLQTSYNNLRYEVENHEIEMRFLEERLNSQETILDILRQQFVESNLSNQEMAKGNVISLEKRMGSVDSTLEAIEGDLRQLQNHANDSSKALATYKQKINDLEKQIVAMHGVIDSLLAVLQIEEAPAQIGQHQTYVVKPGDRLEKIARINNTTIEKIKEINNLKNDRIFIGQKLKMP